MVERNWRVESISRFIVATENQCPYTLQFLFEPIHPNAFRHSVNRDVLQAGARLQAGRYLNPFGENNGTGFEGHYAGVSPAVATRTMLTEFYQIYHGIVSRAGPVGSLGRFRAKTWLSRFVNEDNHPIASVQHWQELNNAAVRMLAISRAFRNDCIAEKNIWIRNAKGELLTETPDPQKARRYMQLVYALGDRLPSDMYPSIGENGVDWHMYNQAVSKLVKGCPDVQKEIQAMWKKNFPYSELSLRDKESLKFGGELGRLLHPMTQILQRVNGFNHK